MQRDFNTQLIRRLSLWLKINGHSPVAPDLVNCHAKIAMFTDDFATCMAGGVANAASRCVTLQDDSIITLRSFDEIIFAHGSLELKECLFMTS